MNNQDTQEVVFQLVDDQPCFEGKFRFLVEGIQFAPIVPVLYDHSRQRIVGRVVRVWREEHRILGALEFAPTPSGEVCAWSTQIGTFSHVSPLFLTQSAGPVKDSATITEVTLANLRSDAKCIRNVRVRQAATYVSNPSMETRNKAGLWADDPEEMQAWLAARPLEAIGIPIDHRPHQWEDPILEPIG